MLTGSWQDHLQLRRLQTHEVVTGLSGGDGDNGWGERGKGKMRQPRVRDNLSQVNSIKALNGAEHYMGESCGTELESLSSPEPGGPS